MTQSWATESSTGDNHHTHMHHNTMISAVAYFSSDDTDTEYAPIKFYGEGLKRVFSNFKFEFEPSEFNIYNSLTWTLVPNKYTIIVFPGHMDHGTEINISPSIRYCVGANYFFNGSVGIGKEYSLINVNVSGDTK